MILHAILHFGFSVHVRAIMSAIFDAEMEIAEDLPEIPHENLSVLLYLKCAIVVLYRSPLEAIEKLSANDERQTKGSR